MDKLLSSLLKKPSSSPSPSILKENIPSNELLTRVHSAATIQPKIQTTNINPFSALQNTLKKPQVQNVPATAALDSTPQSSIQPDATLSSQTPSAQTVSVATVTPPADSTDLAALGKFEFSTQPVAASSDATAQFQNLLQILDNELNEPGTETVADNLRRTLNFLSENPFMRDILVPEDVQRIVRAMRKSYGGAIVKKTKRKTKRTQIESQANDLVDMLGTSFFS